jgi:hypothetical protein
LVAASVPDAGSLLRNTDVLNTAVVSFTARRVALLICNRTF